MDGPNLAKESVEYINKHKLQNLFEKLTEDLVRAGPEDPIDFLIDRLKEYKEKGLSYSYGEPKVIFVLGGPGSGKGTQCDLLVKNFGFVHFSAGELLREEVKSGSPDGELIENIMKNGEIVPHEITIRLLRNAMHKYEPATTFLIDGFPRSVDQAIAFEQEVTECQFILFFDCPEEEMTKRLMQRAKESGRIDDNPETIKKRFNTYMNQTMPVIEKYDRVGKVKKIDAASSVDKVFEEVKKLFH